MNAEVEALRQRQTQLVHVLSSTQSPVELDRASAELERVNRELERARKLASQADSGER